MCPGRVDSKDSIDNLDNFKQKFYFYKIKNCHAKMTSKGKKIGNIFNKKIDNIFNKKIDNIFIKKIDNIFNKKIVILGI